MENTLTETAVSTPEDPLPTQTEDPLSYPDCKNSCPLYLALAADNQECVYNELRKRADVSKTAVHDFLARAVPKSTFHELVERGSDAPCNHSLEKRRVIDRQINVVDHEQRSAARRSEFRKMQKLPETIVPIATTSSKVKKESNPVKEISLEEFFEQVKPIAPRLSDRIVKGVETIATTTTSLLRSLLRRNDDILQ